MKVLYMGFLPDSENVAGGGEVKTKTVLRALKETHKFSAIETIDTSNWRNEKIKIMAGMAGALLKTDYFIAVASTSTFLSILPVVLFFQKIKRFEVHFIPVGNCLVTNFDHKAKIRNINRISGVYVQSETIKTNLKSIGVRNAYVMHNFKYSAHYSEPYKWGEPLKYVFLSRISEEKGIFECIDVIKRINRDSVKCELDIYGKIDSIIEERFFRAIDGDSSIRYKGIVQPQDAAAVLKPYYMLIFPTRYEGEGFPGAVIDAFAAGIPLLSSKFANYKDMLKDGYDSILFEFQDYGDMYRKMLFTIHNREIIERMRSNSCRNISKYEPEKEIEVIIRNMNRT